MTQSSGFQPLSSFGSEYNSLRFIILSILSKIRTATLCEVLSVTNNGGVSPVGFVDLQPLVNQVTGAGISMAQGQIYHIPYFRLQGGANAVILDPQVGDIGIAIFADSDISNVVINKSQSNPGSSREFNVSDGLYIGGFLNGTPNQYVEFSSSGIKVNSPTLINLVAPDIQLNAQTIELSGSASVTITTPTFTVNATNIAMNGNTSVTGTLQNNSVDVGSGHAHQVSGVQTGSSTIETSAPNV
jgi:hypothetical protein